MDNISITWHPDKKHPVVKDHTKELDEVAKGLAKSMKLVLDKDKSMKEAAVLLEDLHDKNVILARLCIDLCMIINNANAVAFDNGVTDPTGSIDEGDVRAAKLMAEAKKVLGRFIE